MSLAIDVDTIVAVLLVDGWHEVAERSFTMDSYEFIWWSEHADTMRDDPMLMHGGGQGGVCATGFRFKVKAEGHIAGPLTAILAVRQDRTLER